MPSRREEKPLPPMTPMTPISAVDTGHLHTYQDADGRTDVIVAPSTGATTRIPTSSHRNDFSARECPAEHMIPVWWTDRESSPGRQMIGRGGGGRAVVDSVVAEGLL
jgi:hypothetical protein